MKEGHYLIISAIAIIFIAMALSGCTNAKDNVNATIVASILTAPTERPATPTPTPTATPYATVTADATTITITGQGSMTVGPFSVPPGKRGFRITCADTKNDDFSGYVICGETGNNIGLIGSNDMSKNPKAVDEIEEFDIQSKVINIKVNANPEAKWKVVFLK